MDALSMRFEMPEKRKKHDWEFREGAVRIVEETHEPIAQVARGLGGVNEATLRNWVTRAGEAREGRDGLSRDDVEELKRLRAGNAELRMERDVWFPESGSASRYGFPVGGSTVGNSLHWLGAGSSL
jgi:transposase